MRLHSYKSKVLRKRPTAKCYDRGRDQRPGNTFHWWQVWDGEEQLLGMAKSSAAAWRAAWERRNEWR